MLKVSPRKGMAVIQRKKGNKQSNNGREISTATLKLNLTRFISR